MRLWRRNQRVRLHVADHGTVLGPSFEGVLIAKRGGFYVLIDAITIGEDGEELPSTGPLEVPAAKVIAREVIG